MGIAVRVAEIWASSVRNKDRLAAGCCTLLLAFAVALVTLGDLERNNFILWWLERVTTASIFV